MRSAPRGEPTSDVEVTNVSKHGFWLLLGDKEVFLSFEHFPWFKDASISSLLNVRRPMPHHLHWPDLDVDLSVESLDHPEMYPLVSKLGPKKRDRRGGKRTRR